MVRLFNGSIVLGASLCSVVQGGDAEGEPVLAVVLKAGFIHFAEESSIFRKLLNRFGQVGVGLVVFGNYFSKSGQNVLEIKLVNISEGEFFGF